MDRFEETWKAAVASTGSVARLVPKIMKKSAKYKDLNER